MMTIPDDFRWVDMSLEKLNALSEKEKESIYKNHEMNIRQCLGEAVPTPIFQSIAKNIVAYENRDVMRSRTPVMAPLTNLPSNSPKPSQSMSEVRLSRQAQISSARPVQST